MVLSPPITSIMMPRDHKIHRLNVFHATDWWNMLETMVGTNLKPGINPFYITGIFLCIAIAYVVWLAYMTNRPIDFPEYNASTYVITLIMNNNHLMDSLCWNYFGELWQKICIAKFTLHVLHIPWHLKSPASRLFAEPFVEAQNKENIKVSRHRTLWAESIGDR